MLSSILLPLACAALPTLDTFDLQAAASMHREPMAVGIQITATQFRARNLSSIPQVFVFRETSGGEIALCPLVAGGEMVFSFPADAITSLEFEVISRRGGAWSDTGFMKLDGMKLDASSADAGSIVWIRSNTGHSPAWLETRGGFAPFESEASTLPTRVLDTLRDDESLPPTHVPVITPSDRPNGDIPPKLEDGPLPPV